MVLAGGAASYGRGTHVHIEGVEIGGLMALWGWWQMVGALLARGVDAGLALFFLFPGPMLGVAATYAQVYEP